MAMTTSIPYRLYRKATWLLLVLSATGLSPVLAGASQPVALHGPEAHQQFIVRFRTTDAGPLRQASRSAILQRAAMRLPASADALSVRQVREMALGPVVVRVSRLLDPFETETFMRALAADPQVDLVQPDHRLQSNAVPNDVHYPRQWGIGPGRYSINVRPAWDLATGSGATVAVIDSGTTTHQDLDAQLLPGYDFISDPGDARDGDGRDDNPGDEGTWGAEGDCKHGRPLDSDWHGTKVAGILAAVTNNREGIAGVAYGARVLPIRVLGKCRVGATSDILDAVLWAAGFSVPGVRDNPNRAHVINLSLGGIAECSTLWQETIDRVVDRGITVVAGAGNNDMPAKDFTPANCLRLIAVGSLDENGEKSDYSNWGEHVDLMAPGNGVLSTSNGGSTYPETAWYSVDAGTSFATPHVSGVIALMQQGRNRPLGPGEVESILKSTARDLSSTCAPIDCGHGLVDAKAAVEMARKVR